MLTPDKLTKVRLIAFDFDGVFTDNTVLISEDGLEYVRCWRSDGLGLSRLKEIGIQAIIISTEVNTVVSERAKKLKIPVIQSVENKAEAMLTVCEKLCISPNDTMFVGNDINDIPAFRSVAFPVGVADSHPDVYPYIVYRTQKPGGLGAVREICDLVYHAHKII